MSDLVHYLTLPFLLRGALVAAEVAALSLAGGLLLSMVVALMRLSPIKLISNVAHVYVWLIRGTPLLLQLVFLYDVLPYVGIVLDPITTAVLGFSLNEAAFGGEIIRGGILSVNQTQTLAAASLGMNNFLTMRRIVMPQAMRAILPALGNDAIALLKGTSLASVIAVNELLLRSQQLASENFKFFAIFGAAGLMYLVMTSAIGWVQGRLERHFDPDRKGEQPSAAVDARRIGKEIANAQAPMSALTRFIGIPYPPSSSPQFARDETANPVAEIRVDTSIPSPTATPIGPHHDDAANVATAVRPSFMVCEDVRKAYGGREVLKGIDLVVGRGEVVVVIGPSGSGKSTLLRLINHLETLDGGEIKVDGSYVGYRKEGSHIRPTRDIARARADARIGMVFQHFNLFEHLTVLENVIEAPVRVYKEDPGTAREKAVELLASVGLASHINHLPRRLSGGQQQRVAIVRALAISPKLMLFDEPTSALDPELVADVLAVIKRLAQTGMTMIVITHEIGFAREVADRVIFIDEGFIVEQGSAVDVLERSKQERTRRFLRLVEREADSYITR